MKNSLPKRQNNKKWIVIDKNIRIKSPFSYILIEFCHALFKVNRNDFKHIINSSSTRVPYFMAALQ